jgi:hypothetical protein
MSSKFSPRHDRQIPVPVETTEMGQGILQKIFVLLLIARLAEEWSTIKKDL